MGPALYGRGRRRRAHKWAWPRPSPGALCSVGMKSIVFQFKKSSLSFTTSFPRISSPKSSLCLANTWPTAVLTRLKEERKVSWNQIYPAEYGTTAERGGRRPTGRQFMDTGAPPPRDVYHMTTCPPAPTNLERFTGDSLEGPCLAGLTSRTGSAPHVGQVT